MMQISVPAVASSSLTGRPTGEDVMMAVAAVRGWWFVPVTLKEADHHDSPQRQAKQSPFVIELASLMPRSHLSDRQTNMMEDL